MTHPQWEAIERTLSGLSLPDKLELIERIAHSIRSESTSTPDRASGQRKNLDRLRKEMEAMPADEPQDGLSNRDHDRVLYGEKA